MKRYRAPKAKPGELKAQWGKLDRYSNPDLCYVWGEGIKSCDSRLLHLIFSTDRFSPTLQPSFLKELESRGYDLKTLRFSIQKRES